MIKREHADERNGDPLEGGPVRVEDVAQEGQQRGRDDGDEHKRPPVAAELLEHPAGRRARDSKGHRASVRATNASSSLGDRRRSRSSAGVPSARSRPSRIRRRRSQRSASSITWVENEQR